MSFSLGYVFDLCVFSESCWEEKSTGQSCSPAHVSQRSCSSSSCPGSQRVHVTCSLTREMKRDVRKVNLTLLLLPFAGLQRLISNPWQGGLKGSITPWNHKTSKLRVETCDHNKCLSHHVKRNWFDAGGLYLDRILKKQTCEPDQMRGAVHVEKSTINSCATLLPCVQPWSNCTALSVIRNGRISARRGIISQVSLLRNPGSSYVIEVSAGSFSPSCCSTPHNSWMESTPYVHDDDTLPAGSHRVDVQIWIGGCVFKCVFSMFPLDLLLCRLLVQTSWDSQW